MTDIVFLPGLHGDAQTWAPVMRALPDGVHATPLDLPAVADLDALVDEVAGRVVPGGVLVGHSLGGVVAMHLAERHPSLLAGLVLGTAPVGAEDPESAKARADRAAGMSPKAYGEIALDGMEAVNYGDRGHDVAAAAWAAYAPARSAMVYVRNVEHAAANWGLRATEAGANVLLIEPAYSVGMERTMTALEGLSIAHPTQVAVDLMTGPGRAPAEANELIEWMRAYEQSWRG